MNLRLDRFEMKFAVTPAQRARLMAELGPHLRPDEYAGDGARYPVVSLYFDNAERDCYWEKARGLPSRRKLRVRVYGSRDGTLPAAAFIEIKHKCDGRGVKRRVRLPLAQALRVGAGLAPEGVALSATEQRLIAEVQALVLVRKFAPVLVLRYDRTAFAALDPASDLRVTFDEDIRARVENLTPEPADGRFAQTCRVRDSGRALLEVKMTGCIPYWLSRTIAAAGCRQEGHSKYSAALERHDPVLRAMLAPAWLARRDAPALGNFTASGSSVLSAGSLVAV